MAVMRSAHRLLEAIRAVVSAVQDVSIGTVGVSSTVRVSPPNLQAVAQLTIDAFDWSPAAQAVWENLDARRRADVLLGSGDADHKLLRAGLLALLDLVNVERVQHGRVAVTPAQLRIDIMTKLSAGGAD